jgi:hypothetical protein
MKTLNLALLTVIIALVSCYSETEDVFFFCSQTINELKEGLKNASNIEDSFQLTDENTVYYFANGKFFSTFCYEINKIQVPHRVQTCTRDLYIFFEHSKY